MSTFQTTSTSLIGMTSVQLANTVDVSVLGVPSEQTTLILQIILAVATLIKMFKTKKE